MFMQSIFRKTAKQNNMLIKILLLTGLLSTLSTDDIVIVTENASHRTITHRDGTTTDVLTDLSEFLDYAMMKEVTELATGLDFIVNRDYILAIDRLGTGSRIRIGGSRAPIPVVTQSIEEILDYSSDFVGEIKIYAGDSIPTGWAECDGRSLSISNNKRLFKAIGYTFGGSGSSFNLPDMRGRTFVGKGQFTGISGSILNYTLGSTGGLSSVTLDESQIPAHNHDVRVISTRGQISSPVNNFISDADPFDGDFGNSIPDTTLNPASISNTGGGQPHENRPPFTVFKIIIKK